MPNVADKSPPDNWTKLHDASLDALVRGSPEPKPYRPYPGDHPCEIAGCAANAPFGFAALPRRVWFCRNHLEEIKCEMEAQRPTQWKFSQPSVGPEVISGEKDTTTGPVQLTFFNDGPSTTD